MLTVCPTTTNTYPSLQEQQDSSRVQYQQSTNTSADEEAWRNLHHLAENYRPSSNSNLMATQQAAGMRPLGPEFLGPGENDVICARGKRALNHSGNRKFRGMIEANLHKYSLATTKLEKSLIVSSIVQNVRESSPDGGFVKQEEGIWYEVGDHIAREKCGQRYVHQRFSTAIVVQFTGSLAHKLLLLLLPLPPLPRGREKRTLIATTNQ